jgi:hypothetical protein
MFYVMLTLLRNRRKTPGAGLRLSPIANYEMLKPSLQRTASTQ